MKTLRIVLLALFMVIGSTGSGVLFGAESSDAVHDHLELAALYRQGAVALEHAIILEHQKIKQVYPKKFQARSASGGVRNIQEMEKRCDAVISDATKLRDDLLDFAKWHHMRAAELRSQ